MWIDYFLNFPVLFAIAYYYWRVLDIERGFWRTLGLNAIWFLPTQYLNAYAALHMDNVRLLAVAGTAQLLSIILFVKPIARRRWRACFASSLILLICIFLGSETGRLIARFLAGFPEIAALPPAVYENYLATACMVLSQCVFLFIAAESICAFLKRHNAHLRWSAFSAVLVVQVVSCLMIAALCVMTDQHRGRVIYLFSIYVFLCFAANLHMLRMFRETVSSTELEQKLQLREQQEALQQEQYRSIGEQIIALRRMKHDYNNTLDTIRLLIAGGNVQEADALAETIRKQLEEGIGRYTGHPVVDAVLYRKLQQAAQAGVEMELQLAVPAKLPVEDRDLLSIFANLLDNAFEYLATLPEGTKKRVVVAGNMRGRMLALRFMNTFLGTEAPEFRAGYTTKADAGCHGMGLEIVRTAVAAYGGSVTPGVQDGMLVVTILLNLPERAAEETEK